EHARAEVEAQAWAAHSDWLERERRDVEPEAWDEYWAREAEHVAALTEPVGNVVESPSDAQERGEPGIPLQVMSEFSAAMAATEPEPAEPEPAVAEPRLSPPQRSELADTAALLMELSSLGVDDDDPAPVRPAPIGHPRSIAQPPKPKKRSFFGR
ncbi:MAG: hypothetical protein ACYCO3_09705, partial [Mycobacteriales bacterium]